jgi:hypothetical protein
MTDEKLLEAAAFAVREAVLAVNEDADSAFIRKVMNHPDDFWGIPSLAPVLTIYAELRDRVGKKTVGSTYSVLKRMANNPAKRDLDGAWIGKNGMHCICNGFMGVRLSKEPTGIPECSGIPSFDGIVDNAKADTNKTLPLPTVGELKAYIAQSKAFFAKKSHIVWWWGEGTPAVSANLLLDMLTLFPDAETVAYSTPVSILYFSDGHGDGILCPIRMTSETRESLNRMREAG